MKQKKERTPRRADETHSGAAEKRKTANGQVYPSVFALRNNRVLPNRSYVWGIGRRKTWHAA
jgi:hypothetical protein